MGGNGASETSASAFDQGEEASPAIAETGETKTPDIDQAKRTLQASKVLAARFGEIVALLMRSPTHKHYTLADLEWMIVPPLLNNQLVVAEARSESKGLAIPVGLALWASVAADVDAKLSNNLDRPVRLHPNEWRSGDKLWLIDVVGTPQIVHGLMEQLSTTVFAGGPYKVRHRNKDGARSVRTISLKADESRSDDAD